jgi:1,2-diacylglycerol 3-beta-galactosyltransferase
MPKRILIAFSDSGGGHRSAGEAIAERLTANYSQQVAVEMVDVLKDYAPYPLNRLPAWYPAMIRYGAWAWGTGFWVSNGAARVRVINRLVWYYVRGAVRRLMQEHPADLVVSVHPLLVDPLLRGLGSPRPPFVTVVTDLVSGHKWWYHPQADLCLVPTEAARAEAQQCGLRTEKIRVVGLPVAARFGGVAPDKMALKAKLGWDRQKPVVLLVGGSEGMGPIYAVAHAISEAELPCELVVVAGRNRALYERLRALHWKTPTRIYGFVTEMPDFTRAADVLVTKAGPGALGEAFAAGVPLILYNYISGQEAGNVAYVVEQKAGVWAATSARVVEALRRWVGPGADPQAIREAAANSKRLARLNAADEVAELLWKL